MGKPHYRVERVLLREGAAFVAGVDEVGRGPLAGPVTVAAVILNPKDLPKGVDDSKALSAAAREALFEIIMSKALSVAIAFASAAGSYLLVSLTFAPVISVISSSDIPTICEIGSTR